MMYLLIKNGQLIEAIGAVDASQANRKAAELGGVAVLIIGRQDPDAIFQHIQEPLSDLYNGIANEDPITEEEIQRILNAGGVEVTSEKVNDSKDS